MRKSSQPQAKDNYSTIQLKYIYFYLCRVKGKNIDFESFRKAFEKLPEEKRIAVAKKANSYLYEHLLKEEEKRKRIKNLCEELMISEKELLKLLRWRFLEFFYFSERENRQKNSKEIKEQIKEWVRKKYIEKPFLVLVGKKGTGKTTVARKIGIEFWKKGRSVEFLNVNKFNKIAYDFDSISEYLEDNVKGADLFIMDDTFTLMSSPHREEIVFSIIDARYSLKKPTVITTNVDIFSLNGEDTKALIADRLKELSFVVYFDYPSLRDEKVKHMAEAGKVDLCFHTADNPFEGV